MAELGVPPSEALEEARLALQTLVEKRAAVESSNPASATLPKPERSTSRNARFIGREVEEALIERIITATTKRQASDVLLVTGEAGIGKSRLLASIADQIMSAGGNAWIGRGFEVEAARTYGIWFDILRPMAQVGRGKSYPAILACCSPISGPSLIPAISHGCLTLRSISCARSPKVERALLYSTISNHINSGAVGLAPGCRDRQPSNHFCDC